MNNAKKIVSLLLVVALTAGIAIAGTLAYLTQDVGDEKNVFSVGNIDITLDEEVGVYGEGGEVKKTEDGAEYTDIMPGDYLKKEVTVYNNGKTDAYVAVTVTINNAKEINNAIDDVYGDDKAQAMYDFIFDGWGLNHSKVDAEGNALGMRLTITGDDMPECALQVDSVKTIDEYTLVYAQNWWENQSTPTTQGEFTGYYSKNMDTYELCYTYYLYLPAGESTTLFKGLNVPAEFTNEQMKMFDGLEINVEAKAIQADNMGVAEIYADDPNGEAKTAFSVLAGTIDAGSLGVNNAPQKIEVGSKDTLLAAIGAAEDGDTIVMTADINMGNSDVVSLKKPITLNMGGYTLSSSNTNNAVQLYNGASLKNGTVAHAGTVAAIKVWGADSIENVNVELSGVSGNNNAITGICVQKETSYIKSLKNVTVTSTGGNLVYNGIETYNCGDRDDYAIGSMENVKVDVNGTALVLSAPAGTATGCTFKGGEYGINAHLKGNYNVSLTLVNCEVSGDTHGIYAWDEGAYTNPGSLKLVGENTTVTGGVEANASEEFGDRWSITGLN